MPVFRKHAQNAIPTWRFLLLFAGLTLLLLSDTAVASPPVRMVPIKVGPHCYYVQGQLGEVSRANQGFNSNAGFVITPAGVVVFDALGTPALGQQLIQAIRRLTPLPIRRVIVSHYHADHVYGLQALKTTGADVWAWYLGQNYLHSDIARQRLAERRRDLAPWVNVQTHLVPADKWLRQDTSFTLGGLHFRLLHVGPAHTPEDMAMLVVEDGVLYAGDVVVKGRIPYLGTADARTWLHAIDKLLPLNARVLVPGHGPASTHPRQAMVFTRQYLTYLLTTMGAAARNLTPFEEAYAKTNWRQYAHLPAFSGANKANAYNTYIRLEQESLETGSRSSGAPQTPSPSPPTSSRSKP